MGLCSMSEEERYDQMLEAVLKQSLVQLEEDRKQAQMLFDELYVQFLHGKNTPDDVRELNKAQELIQKTTEQMIKVLGKLAQIKSGAAKVQIAQINSSTQQLPAGAGRKELIAALEEYGILPEGAKILEEEGDKK